jgi:Bacterial protein of unknown function (DUF885)
MNNLTNWSRRVILLLLCLHPCGAQADTLNQFNENFWSWRAQEQPFSEDDIPRLERPRDLVIDWSRQMVETRRQQLAALERRWKLLTLPAHAVISQQVNYRLLGSALARARWELDVQQGWKRNPEFYVDQTLGAVYVLLLPPAPFQAERQREIVHRLESVPATIRAAQTNLTDIRQPFALLAINALENLSNRMQTMTDALSPQLSQENKAALAKAAVPALASLLEYRQWLQAHLPQMRKDTAIGRQNYLFFLRNIALLAYSPEQLLAMSQQEWSRSVAFESYERLRNAELPPLRLLPTQQAQMEREKSEEEQIRALLAKQHLLTIPGWIKHYRNLPIPAYVTPFAGLGVTDDLTGPSRLDQDGTSYIRVPGPNLGFFPLSTAQDPRPIIVHEGVPGHYFQLCLSWANPDPIRRHYYDSGANEGIGFYAEEMMLQAGLFDNSPRTREIIYSFMRLRALRVEADVKLALGIFSLQQAADYLTQTVPMDHGTALSEAALFASSPGQAISYQIGKIQITQMLADVRRQQGKNFSLLKFNDFVWSNGNVPLALQRWELLGDGSAVPAGEPLPQQ